MDNAKSQLIDKLKSVNSVLITVSSDPSVDQLAACIGLTLLVNKLDKHGSAVFSGKIPSTIEFLKPEETIEKNADSLRDFIIALDKSKADKLRYKVEDQMVKIFITPYRTSLSRDNFEFSQGDFNVELIIALGVEKQEDLDQAITAHGRILHDATVAVINTSDQSDLGTINWREPTASSLCELITDMADGLDGKLLDEQIATALLTGIIAETNRFSNEKTSPQTMSVSSKLMAAGANQQLVASNLNSNSNSDKNDHDNDKKDDKGSESSDGTLSIKHDEDDLDMTKLPAPSEDDEQPPEVEQPEEPDLPAVGPAKGSGLNDSEFNNKGPRLVTEPPSLGGTLTANSVPEQYDPSTDPLSNAEQPSGSGPTLDSSDKLTIEPPGVAPLSPIDAPPAPAPLAPPLSPPPPLQPVEALPALTPVSSPPPQPPAGYTPPPPTWTPPPPSAAPIAPPPAPPSPPLIPVDDNADKTPEQTLNEIEQAVNSPHLNGDQTVDDARSQVQAVLNTIPDHSPPVAENAMPLGAPLHEDMPPAVGGLPSAEQTHNTTGLDPSLFSEVPPVPPPVQYPNNLGSDNPTSS